jgi:hypothetical protein
MISLDVGECKVDILPIVNGLVSEADRVRQEFSDHEAYGAALSIEGIQCLKNRFNIEDTFDVSELDMVYAKHMERFGEVEIPSPAMYTFIDLVTERDKLCIPLDMNDADFTEVYCDTVGVTEFIKEHNVAKRGMKRIFDGSTPERLAKQWDRFVNDSLKSYGKLSEIREQHIADEIRDVAKYRKSLLVIMEVERVDGVVSRLQ